MKQDITYDEWRQALEEIQVRKCAPVPEGWLNPVELGEILQRSSSQVAKIIVGLLQIERIERRKFEVVIAGGKSTRSLWHYRLLPASKAATLPSKEIPLCLGNNGKAAQTSESQGQAKKACGRQPAANDRGCRGNRRDRKAAAQA